MEQDPRQRFGPRRWLGVCPPLILARYRRATKHGGPTGYFIPAANVRVAEILCIDAFNPAIVFNQCPLL